MAAIFQMAFSKAFSWMKILKFQLEFHQFLFPGVQLQYSSIGLDNSTELFIPNSQSHGNSLLTPTIMIMVILSPSPKSGN